MEGKDWSRATEEFLEAEGGVGQNVASVWTEQFMGQRQYRGLIEFWAQEVTYLRDGAQL